MIYEIEPNDFSSKFEVVSCFAQHRESILLLLRNIDKPEGSKWGTPAGKVDRGETLQEAMRREFRQETGLTIVGDFDFLKTLFVRYPDYDFIYHVFKVVLPEKGIIRINPKEHSDFRWKEPWNALEVNLVLDQDSVIKMFYPLKTG